MHIINGLCYNFRALLQCKHLWFSEKNSVVGGKKVLILHCCQGLFLRTTFYSLSFLIPEEAGGRSPQCPVRASSALFFPPPLSLEVMPFWLMWTGWFEPYGATLSILNFCHSWRRQTVSQCWRMTIVQIVKGIKLFRPWHCREQPFLLN